MKRDPRRASWILIGLLALASPSRGEDRPSRLAPPIEDGPFLRPAAEGASEPVWGIKGGIAVGLWPTSGPRGLIRVYTPYLGLDRPKMINFIAVEPIVEGRTRGLSELERSELDEAEGKAMWTGDRVEAASEPKPPWQPSRGSVAGADGSRTLTFFVLVEPFKNGARPVVEVTLREDRPHEVGFRLFAASGGRTMRSCILSATMGNYARLRTLHLQGGSEDVRPLWGDAPVDRWGFLPHKTWGSDRLLVRDGEALAAAVPDEADPQSATYDPKVPRSWHYRGRKGTQFWRAPRQDDLVVRVNARRTYWANEAPIPGGISFENFEFEAPFVPGQRFTFGVIPEGPEALGFGPASR